MRVLPLEGTERYEERVVPIELFSTFAEAQASRESHGSSFATGLAIGLSAVAVVGLGIALCYVLFKRQDTAAPPVYVPQPMPFPYPMLGYGAPPVPQQDTKEPPVAAKDVLDYLKGKR
jgi:hypothetical protein